MAIHGGCACGAVKYELAQAELLPTVYCCHCSGCQSRTGSGFVQTAVVAASDVEVSGPLATISQQEPGGKSFEMNLCGTCASRLYFVIAAYPDKLLLQAGTLDDSDTIEPVAHIWTSRKQPWVGISDGVPQWEEAPSEEFYALVGYI
jgi:hypothetical protein